MDLRLARFKNLLYFVHFVNENVHSKVFRPFIQSVGRSCQRQSLLRLRRRRRRRQYVFAQKMRKLLFFLFFLSKVLLQCCSTLVGVSEGWCRVSSSRAIWPTWQLIDRGRGCINDRLCRPNDCRPNAVVDKILRRPNVSRRSCFRRKDVAPSEDLTR